MNTKNDSFDLMNEIVSQANTDVNNFLEFIPQNIPSDPDMPDIMKDYIFNNTPNHIQFFNRHLKESPEVTEINKAFVKLKEKAEMNEISDTFRSEDIKEAKHSTARSLKKTLDSFSRYYSILQKSN